MKPSIQRLSYALLLAILLSGCSAAATPVTPVPPSATVQPAPTATQTPSPTAVSPIWMEIRHSDLPFEYSATDPFYYEKAISGAAVGFDTDTRWNIEVQVETLKDDVGESSTGILLRGLTRSGQMASLYLVYQYGYWSVGYGVNHDSSYWQTFKELTEPAQAFELSISADGTELSLRNQRDFKFKHQMPVILFPDRGTVQLGTQIGPHTRISVSKFVIDQLRPPAFSPQTASDAFPASTAGLSLQDAARPIVFDYYRSGYEHDFPDVQGDSNVFLSNLDGTDPAPITNGLMFYNHVAGVSPDGQKVLIQTMPANYTTYEGTSGIYVVDLRDKDAAPVKLAAGVFDMGRTTAAWLDNAHIVFIDLVPGGMAIFSMNIDGSDRKRISQKVPEILSGSLFLTNDRSRVFWEGYAEEGRRWSYRGIWWTRLDGSEQSKLSQSGIDQDFHLENISPDGSMVVWTEVDDMTWTDCKLYVASVSEIDRPSAIKLDCRDSYQVLWSPDGSKVLIHSEGRLVESSGFTNPNSALIVSPADLTVREFRYPIDNMRFGVQVIGWSPDGQSLLVKIHRLLQEEAAGPSGQTTMGLFTLESKTLVEVFTHQISDDAVGAVHWLLRPQ
jgi:hypothetical protein